VTNPYSIGINDVLAAAHRLKSVVRRTPLERSGSLSQRAGAEVFVKLETQQRTGSFKLRGACNAVAMLTATDRAAGVVTASAGNHGLGVAYAARLYNVPATVFVPADASRVKRERIRALGAVLREVPGTYDDAHAASTHFAAETAARYIHAFSDPHVVAGQGTVGLEILEELPDARTILAPVGGGGLIGGVGIVARALAPEAKVIGVQSRETAAMHASLREGSPVLPPMGPTLCDGLAGEIDAHSLALAQRVVDRMVLVEEGEVERAIHRLYTDAGTVAEGSAAVVAAALTEERLGGIDGPVAAILSGSNIDAAVLGRILLG
jgi:threonine dehydratase